MSEFDELPLNYETPVAELLELGDDGLQWSDSFDYQDEFELSAEHVPELLRMATDDELHNSDPDSLRVWGPIHAIRALGQLRAADAVEPLLNVIVRNRDDKGAEYDDWLHPAVSDALIEIGTPGVCPAARLIVDQSKDRYSRAVAAKVLSKLGRQDLTQYPPCVAALATALEDFRSNEPELNAFIIGYLVDLDAEETCPLIEQAFDASAVEETIVGDWEDVQVELGHRPPLSKEACREKMHRRFPYAELLSRLLDKSSELLGSEAARARRFGRLVDDLDESAAVLEAPPEREMPVRMTMPEEIYTADERRRLAKKRNKQRKAAKRGEQRGAQAKHRD